MANSVAKAIEELEALREKTRRRVGVVTDGDMVELIEIFLRLLREAKPMP